MLDYRIITRASEICILRVWIVSVLWRPGAGKAA